MSPIAQAPLPSDNGTMVNETPQPWIVELASASVAQIG
jgi:hypothetical protein